MIDVDSTDPGKGHSRENLGLGQWYLLVEMEVFKYFNKGTAVLVHTS